MDAPQPSPPCLSFERTTKYARTKPPMKTSLLLLLISSLAVAQTARTTPVTDVRARPEAAVSRPGVARIAPSATSSTNAATSVPATTAKYEYYTNVVIAAGQTVNLDSALDYSSSDTVRVTVRSANNDLLALLGTAYFTVPNVTEFLTQEAFLGSDFFYSNSGGATFQVCGPQFRLALRNNGTTTMTLSSVLVYTHIL
jgi:hypothetical protein